MCIDKVVVPITVSPSSNKVPFDSDTFWHTKGNNAIPFCTEGKFATRPKLVTFSANNTLFMPTENVGKFFRQYLNDASDMTLRLPRPAIFTTAYTKAFEEM